MKIFDWFKNSDNKKFSAALAQYEACVKSGDLKGSLKALNEMIEIAPTAQLFSFRGHILREMGQVYKALENYEQAIKADQNFAEAFAGRAHVNYGLKKYKSAVQDFTVAIQLDPKYQLAYRNRGSSYAQLGMFDLAFEDYEHALALVPNDALTYFVQGNAFLNSGQFEKAIESFTKALSLDERYASDVYSLRAHAYTALGAS